MNKPLIVVDSTNYLREGDRFTRLVVLRFDSKRGSNKYYECKCDCGNIKAIRGTHLSSGGTKSCGCLAKELRSSHNKSSTTEHSTWLSMKGRCSNSRNISYKNYGGRGITVCDRWLNSFENFYEDMGERPSDNHSIERVDVEGDYTPDNCVWLEKVYQNRNQRKSKNNTSGVTGVTKMRKWWVAQSIGLDGKNWTKSFSIPKLGEELAFFAACETRELMIEKLNIQGANYGEGHGK